MITIATYRCCWTSHDDVTIEPLDFLNSECAYYLCTLRLLNHSLSTHLPIDSLTHLPTHSLTHSLSHPLTHSAHSMDSWLVYPQVSLSVLPNLRRENTALVALTIDNLSSVTLTVFFLNNNSQIISLKSLVDLLCIRLLCFRKHESGSAVKTNQ